MSRYGHSLEMLVLTVALFTLSGCEPQRQNGFALLLANQGAPVTRPANLTFPRDHGAHPEFGIEWWYLTANLTDKENHPVWMQWTLFRTLTPQPENSWSDGQFYMAHLSVHSLQSHFAREKFAQGGVGNAEISARNMRIDNWRLEKNAAGRPHRLIIANEDDARIELTFNVNNTVMLQGENGFSEKYPDSNLASYYYSLPDITVSGSIQLGATIHQVNGKAWYDHEWSSAFLNQEFVGWQWFSLHLEDNSKLMLFSLTPAEQSQLTQHWYGKYHTNNETISLSTKQIQIASTQYYSSKIGMLPGQWQLQIPDIALDVSITPLKREQISPFSILYFEGAVSVSGSSNGVGFVEITQ